jgi:hypothetical protein
VWFHSRAQEHAFLERRYKSTRATFTKQEISVEFKKAIKAEGDFTGLALDPIVPDRTVCIRAEISSQEQAELLQFLDKNSDVFAWSTSDLIGVNKEVIEHKLQVNPNAKPKKHEASQDVRGKNRSCKG